MKAINKLSRIYPTTDTKIIKTQLTCSIGTGLICLLFAGLAFFKQLAQDAAKQPANNQTAANQPANTHTTITESPSDNPKPQPENNPPIIQAAVAASQELTSVEITRRFMDIQLNQLKRFNFSNRERNIAALVLLGETNKSIAEAIRISESTVKNYVQKIFKKTGVKSRTEFRKLARCKTQATKIQ